MKAFLPLKPSENTAGIRTASFGLLTDTIFLSQNLICYQET